MSNNQTISHQKFIHWFELTSELTKREIKQRYKQSILGYAWVILNPFAQMLVMTFVFSTLFQAKTVGVPYAVFIYVGLLPWTLFSGSLTSSVNSLVNNAGLLTKIYFPREIFVISTIIAKIVDFVLATSVLVVMFVWFQIPISLAVLWVIPIFLIQNLFTYGLALVAAATNLFYRDIQYVLGLIITIWFYLTPVLYPVELFPPQYRWIFQLNPMAVFINGYREALLGGGNVNLTSLGIGLIISVILVILCTMFFKKVEGSFADNV